MLSMSGFRIFSILFFFPVKNEVWGDTNSIIFFLLSYKAFEDFVTHEEK